MRHSWIKIPHGKFTCTRCGLIKYSFRAPDKYNTIWKYYYKNSHSKEYDKMPKCK